MISISSYKPTFSSYSVVSGSNALSNGDKALNENRLDDAMKYYNQALTESPDDVDINRKLAKVHQKKKDYALAQQNMNKYLDVNSKEAEAWIELGELQRLQGFYQDAKKSFETALSLDENNDLAKRSIKETENNILSCYSPSVAQTKMHEESRKNLQTALQMATEYLGHQYMKDIADVTVKFGKTASMGGTANIAQYENRITTMTLSDTYKYAAPQVLAAYIVHESVHAHDKDAYTSIREEQDAYEIATKFWIKYSNGVKDPEMDYAAELYTQSPEALKNRVEEIYTLRDPDIAKTSPNHPPQKKFHINMSKTKAANQPIKEYDAIA